MSIPAETTTIAVIGAGVAGLTVANILQRNGIACVVLGRRSRAYVEDRQRAGTVDSFGVHMFHDWGLDAALHDPAPVDEPDSGFFIDGVQLSAPGDSDVSSDNLLSAADAAGAVDWSVSVDSTIARAHQHATNITRTTGGFVELHGSGTRAA